VCVRACVHVGVPCYHGNSTEIDMLRSAEVWKWYMGKSCGFCQSICSTELCLHLNCSIIC